MSQPRNRARGSADGGYFFYVEGLPAFYTWEMLKDLARKAPAYPGWTEMASNPPTMPMQKRRGWVKVRRLRDAYNLYGFFTKGPPSSEQLNVYLWSTAKSPPQLLECNCEAPKHPQAFAQQQTVRVHKSSAPQNPVGFRSHPSVPRRNIPQPTYVYATNNRPVNATRGLVSTQSRGIFISKLAFSINERQLREHLSRIGFVESCDIWKDSSTGSSRGIATAKFATVDVAAKAIRILDGQKVNGKVMKVRFDKEAEMVTPRVVKDCGPIIANGSR